jgi:hypothetical protein
MKTELLAATASLAMGALAASGAAAGSSPTYDINTLAGKVASLRGTAGLQIRFSAFIEQEAIDPAASRSPASPPITPAFVLSSPLDGTSVTSPDVTVNRDQAAAPQNETAIAVDPNNPNRILAGANDYVSRTWSCTIGGVACSALGDGYSGTYYSNNSGQNWCCAASDPAHLGTLIPGVTRLAGGVYDAGGDPSVTFDSSGNAFYAGLGFNRASPPNTVTVNRGAFSSSGALSWSAPTFIGATTSPAIFNDKEWIAADANPASPYRDRIYVSWTRFIFNPTNGAYVQSPIFLAYSKDGGHSFTTTGNIAGNVLYNQGSRPLVAPDGTVYVIFEGATRKSILDSTYIVRSTDGGATFGNPVAISTLVDISTPSGAVFRTNSYPAGAVAPNGTIYVAWSTEAADGHSQAVWSWSNTQGATWAAPAPILPAIDSQNRTPVGYPQAQPGGGQLSAPAAHKPDSFWPGVAISPSGRIYMSAYAADVVSPWQTCASGPPPPVGRISCDQLGPYIDNARLDYYVADLSTGITKAVTTQPINTRYGFGGRFFGDYTDLAVGSDNAFHAFWTDSNNLQTVNWFYGAQFTPTPIHQQDVATAAGDF